MADENWHRSDAQKVEGKRRQGQLRKRWEDCVKRDLERVGGEWRTANEKMNRILLTENVVREK